MSDEIVQKIVESLYEGTKAGAVTWKLRDTIFNSELRHHLHSMSVDGNTEFKIEITLESDFKFKPGTHLYIHNEKIAGGYKYTSTYKNETLSKLEEIIYEKYVQPTVKIKLNKEEDVLEDILNSIGSKEYVRDKKLEQILGSESEQKERNAKIDLINEDKNTEVETTKKKWSLW